MAGTRHRYLIGVGSHTMTDDGIGPRVVEAVEKQARDADFEIVVSSHDAAGIFVYFEDATERIVFVDCVRMGRAPGEWAVFSPGEVESRKPLGRLTTHEGDLLRIIEMGRQLACPIPPITILGIEPGRLEPGLDLSDALRARFDEYVAAAVAEMRRPNTE